MVMLQRFQYKYPAILLNWNPSFHLLSVPRDPKNVVTIGDLSEEEDMSD